MLQIKRASFNAADMEKVLWWQRKLECRILCRKFIDILTNGTYYKDALTVFGARDISKDIYETLMEDAEGAEFSLKIRIYYALSRAMKQQGVQFEGRSYDHPESLCFQTIQQEIYGEAVKGLPDSSQYRIAKDRVDVKLPVRVNWGGGWTDTPPYCNENGGVVLNAAISLGGILPVQITLKKLPEYHVEFESQDIGVKGIVHTVAEIQDCHNPYDSFALHKAALIATGIARNLLRDVVGGYIGARPESVQALKEMQEVAVLMKFHLERGEIDAFAELLNQHWELSKQLDSGSTNTCIDQIFVSSEDLIDARFISGAGGGGFLMGGILVTTVCSIVTLPFVYWVLQFI